MESGGQDNKLVEPLTPLNGPVVILEVEAYPEPKAPSPSELDALHISLGTNEKVAAHIGGSEGYVRDRRALGSKQNHALTPIEQVGRGSSAVKIGKDEII